MKGIFISGTGTDIGKTYVSAQLIKLLKGKGITCGYYKAALSGAIREGNRLVPGDASYVARVTGISAEQLKVSYIYEAAVSPHLAAKLVGSPFSLDKVTRDANELSQACDFIVAEGCGGIICPLFVEKEIIMLTDVIEALAFPLILVADAGLGTINASVLSVLYARSLQLNIVGIVLNAYEEQNVMHIDNKAMIEQLANIPVIATIGVNGEMKLTKEVYEMIMQN